MDEISILRADYYSNGKIIPLVITFSDGSCESISSVKEVKWQKGGKECLIHCSTRNGDITLCYTDSKWRAIRVDK